jgi:hypothetical protein
VGRLLVDYGGLKIELALSMGYAISDKRKGMSDFFKTRGARRSPTEDERVAVKKIVMIALALAAVPAQAQAQNQRTTCYDSGNTRICDTVDGMGNPVSKTRCYKSGKDTRCDTTSINGGASTTPIIPNGGRSQR